MTTRLMKECLQVCVPLSRIIVKSGEAPVLIEALNYLRDKYQIFQEIKTIITDACPTESLALDIV